MTKISLDTFQDDRAPCTGPFTDNSSRVLGSVAKRYENGVCLNCMKEELMF